MGKDIKLFAMFNNPFTPESKKAKKSLLNKEVKSIRIFSQKIEKQIAENDPDVLVKYGPWEMKKSQAEFFYALEDLLIKDYKDENGNKINRDQARAIIELKSHPADFFEINEKGYIVKINLSVLQLKNLPLEIGKLRELEELYCGHNKLKTLPAVIGHLTKLITLECSTNQLTTLPSEIGFLKNLEHLTFYQNKKLKVFPPEICRLKKLAILNFANCKIESLPLSFGNLRALWSLECSHNRLTALPETIGNLENLDELICSANQISEFPRTIGQLIALHRIQCNNNQLTELPNEMENLNSLIYLDLRKNMFSPEQKKKIKKLLPRVQVRV